MVMTIQVFASGDMVTITVDAQDVIGTIPLIHGLVGGPLIEEWWRPEGAACGGYPNWWTADFSRRFRQMGVPAARAHGSGAIDVNAIWASWPDYTPDTHNPANYDFTIADRAVYAAMGVTKIIGRLGFGKGSMSIPGCDWASPPPPQEFAEICGNIIRHFNQGWAWDDATWGPWHDGWRIGTWSVWNEPYYNVGDHGWWTGTPTEFADLYNTVVTNVKGIDPTVRLGPNLQIDTFSDEFFAHWATMTPPPSIDFIDIHLYRESPFQFPWGIHLKPPDVQGHGNWEEYLEAVNLPRSTPLIIGEWNRSIANYASGPSGAAYNMCVLAMLADLAEHEGSDHHVEMACHFAVGKVWMGMDDAPQSPTLAGVAFHFYGEHLALATPRRLAVSAAGPGTAPGDIPVVTSIAGQSPSGRQVTLLLSQYDPANPDDPGTPFTASIAVTGLPGTTFQWSRWAMRGQDPFVPLEVTTSQGTVFRRDDVQVTGNTFEAWILRFCPSDVDDTGTTDVEDLLILLMGWGEVEALTPGDITLDGTIDIQDLLAILSSWGSCADAPQER
jgi:hypothetical protein